MHLVNSHLPVCPSTQVWDRRTMDASGRRSRPAGVFVGHTEGVTHLDSKVRWEDCSA